MSQTLTIARRELTSVLFSPVGYLVLALFAFGTSLIFFLTFGPGQPALLRTTFFYLVWLLIFLVPAISMRLISEEFRAGTIEPLAVAPLSDAQIVVGKWLGALAFFALLLSPLLVLIGVLEWNSTPDYGPILTGLIGLLLVGALYLAIGTFASALTDSQLLAWIVTVAVICVLVFATGFLQAAQWMPDWLKPVMTYLNVNQQFEDFSKGLIDLTNFVYFVSGTMLFLFFAVLLLQSRRWR